MEALLNNKIIVNIIMAVLVFGLTFLIKIPIKLLSKMISNKLPDKCFSAKFTRDNLRRILNLVILLIPFALGILANFLWNTFYLNETIDILAGLSIGTTSISLYGVLNQFLTKQGLKPIENIYETTDGKIVTDTVKQITKDGKVDNEDLDTIKKALNDLKNV